MSPNRVWKRNLANDHEEMQEHNNTLIDGADGGVGNARYTKNSVFSLFHTPRFRSRSYFQDFFILVFLYDTTF